MRSAIIIPTVAISAMYVVPTTAAMAIGVHSVLHLRLGTRYCSFGGGGDRKGIEEEQDM